MPRIPKNKAEADKFFNEVVSPWRMALIMNDKGAPKTCLANGLIALRGHPDWASVLRFDLFSQRTYINGRLPWLNRTESRPWTPNDDTLAANWLQHQGIMLPSKATSECIETVAHDAEFHPVLDYLAQQRWDGEPRLDEWCARYLGAPDTPFVRAVAARWLISAVARVMQPGCKVDCAIVLEGRQGIGKSQALRALFDPWFSDEISELGSKDAAIQIAGVWCLELAELVGIRRGDIERVKAFMSRTFDRYRAPWGTRAADHQRQCVFAGSVNDDEYLRDETGNRRFWPIKCGRRIDLDGLREARSQLWAEASDRYLADEAWWLNSDELNSAAINEQDSRRKVDPWERLIADYSTARSTVSVDEILADLLSIELADRTQLHANRIGACLRALGWERFYQRIGDRRESRYRRSVNE